MTAHGTGPQDKDSARPLFDADRPTFFTDAVVAIAMTLLILPLLESVNEASTGQLTATQWWHEHYGQVGSFVLSFLIIATFWMNHRALFEHVGRMTARLAWLNIGWMLMIVWVPVATSMVGSAMTDDRLRLVLYVGPLLCASALAVLMHRLVDRRPDLWKEHRVDSHAAGAPSDPTGQAVAIAMTALYGLALVIGLLLPTGFRYFAMLVLMGIGPLTRVIRGRLAARSS